MNDIQLKVDGDDLEGIAEALQIMADKVFDAKSILQNDRSRHTSEDAIEKRRAIRQLEKAKRILEAAAQQIDGLWTTNLTTQKHAARKP